jgi:hypothetical protein
MRSFACVLTLSLSKGEGVPYFGSANAIRLSPPDGLAR